MDWSAFVKADSPDYYGEEELRGMLKAFDDQEPDKLTLPEVPFSRPEIQRALIRIENQKQALEDK